jgi:hypothetical protein
VGRARQDFRLLVLQPSSLFVADVYKKPRSTAERAGLAEIDHGATSEAPSHPGFLCVLCGRFSFAVRQTPTDPHPTKTGNKKIARLQTNANAQMIERNVGRSPR